MNENFDDANRKKANHLEKFNIISQIATAVISAIGAMYAAINWMYGLPGWAFNAAILTTTASLLCLLWFWSQSGKRHVPAEPVDVTALLGEVVPNTTITEPIANEAKAELRPPFHAYTSDDIDGLHWTWRWKPDATEPHPDAIEALSCFCPKCGLRIEPRDDLQSREINISKPRPGILATTTPRTMTVYDGFARFECEGRCFDPIKRAFDLKSELGRIRREIERRAKMLDRPSA
jgi:hypothetical protein